MPAMTTAAAATMAAASASTAVPRAATAECKVELSL
jgi:hypothetical protein